MKELLVKVNERREGRLLNSYDYQAVCWKDNLKDQEKYAWKHSNAASHVWSGDADYFLASLDDDYYDKCRAERERGLKAKVNSLRNDGPESHPLMGHAPFTVSGPGQHALNL